MKGKGWIHRLLLLALLWSWMPASPAYACSCAESEPPARAFSTTPAVFHATALASTSSSGYSRSWITELLYGIGIGSGNYGQEIPFEVISSWKGVDKTHVLIHTGFGGGDCGVGFNQGDEYLIYAYGNDDNLETNICTRTRPISRASDDLTYLGGLTPLTLQSGGLPAFYRLRQFGWVLLPVGLIAGIFWWRRKERRKKRLALVEDGR